MIAVWFRFQEDTGNEAYVGIAVAKDMKGLFWQIDQHGDPFLCEIMPLHSGSFLVKTTKDLFVPYPEEDVDIQDPPLTDFEPSGEFWGLNTDGWMSPVWPPSIV